MIVMLENEDRRESYTENATYVENAAYAERKIPKKKKHTGAKVVGILAGVGVFFVVSAGVGVAGVLGVQNLMKNTTITIETPFTNKLPAMGEIKEEAKVGSAEAGNLIEDKASTDKQIHTASPNTGSAVVTDISDIVEEVMPAMVSIINNGTDEMMDFFGQIYTRESESSGTGIIISQTEDELLIATNHHVATGSNKLEITFIDGTTAEAKIKGMDSEMDLAVLAVDIKSIPDDTKGEIAIAKLGDSRDLKLGKPVIVIGNALGYGQSVTTGIISGLNRELTMEDGSTGTYIQTDAAVNPGNSGGALFNIDGEVIGIVSSKIGGSAIEGMGYAIPISSANPIISDMMDHETRGDKVDADEMGYLGIRLQEITPEATKYYNMPAGVFVYEVMPDTGAMAAGIKKGDIIVKLEGDRISSYANLQDILQYYKAGDTISIVVSRQEDGEYVEKELQVTLGARPEE